MTGASARQTMMLSEDAPDEELRIFDIGGTVLSCSSDGSFIQPDTTPASSAAAVKPLKILIKIKKLTIKQKGRTGIPVRHIIVN